MMQPVGNLLTLEKNLIWWKVPDTWKGSIDSFGKTELKEMKRNDECPSSVSLEPNNRDPAQQLSLNT